MPETCWETIKAEGGAVLDKLRDLLHEGNVRRVRIRQHGRTIAEFPLTAGVVGAVFAPGLAAIGAIVAIVQNCTIDVQRDPAEAVVTATDDRSAAANASA